VDFVHSAHPTATPLNDAGVSHLEVLRDSLQDRLIAAFMCSVARLTANSSNVKVILTATVCIHTLQQTGEATVVFPQKNPETLMLAINHAYRVSIERTAVRGVLKKICRPITNRRLQLSNNNNHHHHLLLHHKGSTRYIYVHTQKYTVKKYGV